MAMIRNRKRIVRWFFIISSPPVCSGKNGEHYAGKVKELWKRGEGTVTEAKMREICTCPLTGRTTLPEPGIGDP
ncbi:MAG TPA: hypothetical protein P5515_08350 [Methanolinea sp.]|nr:hypothetical protein [Methanolinea sp.]